MTVQHFKKAMGKRLKNSRKSAQGWGKMGKNGERILWGKHFTIGNFPIFPHWLPPVFIGLLINESVKKMIVRDTNVIGIVILF